jgi:hypothetical protein
MNNPPSHFPVLFSRSKGNNCGEEEKHPTVRHRIKDIIADVEDVKA